MKKRMILVLIGCILFLTGCGKENSANRNIPNTAKEIIWKDTFIELSKVDEVNKVVFYCNADSSEASVAEYIYFVVYATIEVYQEDKNCEFYIDYSGTLYNINPSAKNWSEVELPDEWLKFIEENNIGQTKIIDEFVTKNMADTIEESVEKKIVEPLLKE